LELQDIIEVQEEVLKLMLDWAANPLRQPIFVFYANGLKKKKSICLAKRHGVSQSTNQTTSSVALKSEKR